MAREYNFNNAKYALLTVTNDECVIKKFDWCMFYNDEFQNKESIMGCNEITLTVYEPDEHEEFWNVLSLLSKASDTRQIYVLSDILYEKQKEVK